MTSDFQHFVEAQNGVFESAMNEIQASEKRSHWMWFIFPQLHGLGRSETSRTFGIHDLSEARCYLQHPVLGVRLVQAAQTAKTALENDTPLSTLFGHIDAQKFISCMTLFRQAAGEESIFAQILNRLQTCDQRTTAMLQAQEHQGC